MEEDPSSKVVLRSPSGDTDILVLAVALLDSNRVYLVVRSTATQEKNCLLLVLHIKRANYVAKIWRSFLTSWLDAEEITESGWLADGEAYWVDDIFPLEIEEILCDQAYNADDDFDEEDEQSSSDDDN
ncbi:hypothetical protein GQR58_014786 [Nymphon striatum]|nr:hypothetical protein GQR58_014786 [Nymphon striatum]